MLKIKAKSFNELTTIELYNLLQLRSKVFVVEQNCVYQDIDAKDQKALHILGFKNNKIVAYTRIFKPGDYFDKASIGRVVVAENERKYGYGHLIMEYSIKAIDNFFNEKIIKISAQKYLKEFYKSHNFIQIGEEYLEDNIPHIAMVKSN
ncbi:GNAT family N-acetyltransferase [Lutibacter sp. A64]|uniref:GNAT family N-acetyltransferase n=1 Tax=Lutibacter sp. A64 TaxID=2918526 RepID=UPI001F066571|nr:GNAT family N-acetyltransferase [Lutibacter sp. A64]UMB53033.1 GNAT family N-acetyltransferase [Lutibacter sp. A64]